MWIVRLALNRPYTFLVMSVVILVLGFLATQRMSTDIFPEIDIPVISMIWTYRGMSAEEMEKRVTTFSEFAVTSNVNDIRNIESETLEGIAVEKVFFQPNVNIDLAISQIVSASNSIRALMPTGIQPPVIVSTMPRPCRFCSSASALTR